MSVDEDPDESDMDSSDDDSADTEPCPHCGRPVYDSSQRCPHCGDYISPEHAPWRQSLWIILTAIICLIVIIVIWSRH
jgi:predicted nucleic acid-binding Zn ribbon protein